MANPAISSARAYTAEDTGWTHWYTDCGHVDQSLTTSARLRTSLVGDRVRVRAEWEGKRGFAPSLGPGSTTAWCGSRSAGSLAA